MKDNLARIAQKQATSKEKLVGLCYRDYRFIHKFSRHILVICVLLKIGVEFGLYLGILYCLELDETPHRIFHNKYDLQFIIIFGTKLHSSIHMHLLHNAL